MTAAAARASAPASPAASAAAPPAGERRDLSEENLYRRSIFSVPVTVLASLGRVRMSVREVLDLAPDALVPLEAGVEDPVELIVDGKVIGHADLVETDGGGLALKVLEVSGEEAGGLSGPASSA